MEGLVLMAELSRPFKLRELLALLKKLAALVTVLLLRFFSPGLLCSSLCRRKNPAPGGENLFSRGLVPVVSVWMVKPLVSSSVSGSVSTLSLGGLEEPLNILFSNPPCEEKLRRLFPASLIVFLQEELLNLTGVIVWRWAGRTRTGARCETDVGSIEAKAGVIRLQILNILAMGISGKQVPEMRKKEEEGSEADGLGSEQQRRVINWGA